MLETLRPIVTFLLIGLFSSKKSKAIVVAGVLALFMITEFIIRYSSDKEIIEYSEFIGLTLLFVFERFENKQTSKNEKQISK